MSRSNGQETDYLPSAFPAAIDPSAQGAPSIISKSPTMHAIFDLVASVASTNTTVLLEGETGTGKEQLARAIHAASAHRTGPMVAINCAAMPESLLESE